MVVSPSFCNRKQAWLPAAAATNANTRETGADVKESGLFSGAGHLEGGGLVSQSPSPGKMGDSRLKAHHHLSVQAEVFIRRERGTEEIKGGGCKVLYVQTSPVHSHKASDSGCASSWLVILASRHPGFTSS